MQKDILLLHQRICAVFSRFQNAPTPIAGLALGIGSLGWCWENSGLFQGQAQEAGAMVAATMLTMLVVKFASSPLSLKQDLAHPVIGSVIPTFAMSLMVVSKAIGGSVGNAVWLTAIALHLCFLGTFIWYRSRNFELSHMVPSWFVPPVGIIVAAVSSPGGEYEGLAQILLWVGMASYAVILPVMLYRLTFCAEIADPAKPTIAIMAAPASLSLAGYLTITKEPSLLVVSILLGIAVLMTGFVYLAFFKLMRLPFSPGYAAFTFPMVIGATALFKTAHQYDLWGYDPALAEQILWLARLELYIATGVIAYVATRYAHHFLPYLRKTSEAY